jgi:hypothetical protein
MVATHQTANAFEKDPTGDLVPGGKLKLIVGPSLSGEPLNQAAINRGIEDKCGKIF